SQSTRSQKEARRTRYRFTLCQLKSRALPDVYSRMVLGFAIYLEKPSAFTAGISIAHASGATSGIQTHTNRGGGRLKRIQILRMLREVSPKRWSPFISIWLDNALKSFDSVHIPIGSGDRIRDCGGFCSVRFHWRGGGMTRRLPNGLVIFGLVFDHGVENHRNFVSRGGVRGPRSKLGLHPSQVGPHGVALRSTDVCVASGSSRP